VVNLSRVSGLNDQTNPCTRLLPNEVVVNGTRKKQRRNRGHIYVCTTIGEDKHRCPCLDRIGSEASNILERFRQTLSPGGNRIQTGNDDGSEVGRAFVVGDVDERAQLVIVQDWTFNNYLAA
jgi:hypothetical protein